MKSKSLPRFSLQISGTHRRWLLAFSLAMVVFGLIYVRDPRYFIQPRFWAEEGTLHFAYSYGHGWIASLLQPQVGYLNFWPNLATKLATLVPLETAPLITTWMALGVQLIPAILILSSNSSLWHGWRRKLLGIAIVLFIPLTQEGWLNSINSFTYFPAITFLILLEEDNQEIYRRGFSLILLVLGGLTGVLSCLLTPLFFHQAWLEKRSERWVQALVLGVCSAVQLVLIFGFRGSGDFEQRSARLGFATFGATLWTQSIALLPVGRDLAHAWAERLMELTYQPASFRWVGWALLLMAIVFFGLVMFNLPRQLRLIYSYSYFGILLASLLFSITPEKYTFLNTGLHQRLFLAPNIILGWMLLMGIKLDHQPGWRGKLSWLSTRLCALLLCVGLFLGFWNYWDRWVPDQAWGNWPQEVQAWRADPAYALRIQPEGWLIRLETH